MTALRTLLATPANSAQAASVRTAAQIRTHRNNINLLLWTFQGWLAMFYAGAGYAKLSEPLESLVLLMDWPRGMDADLVRLLGLADIGLALGMLLPLLSWKIGRPILLGATAAMVASQLGFIAYYGVEQCGWMFVVNLALLGTTATVLRLRWDWRS
ncbi:MAG: doxX family protein [Brevundimonas sp.]|nr:doxX family protein [Brevundimonas sp.]